MVSCCGAIGAKVYL